jgi:hypothetical protein
METLLAYFILLSPIFCLVVLSIWHYLECKAIDKRYEEQRLVKIKIRR